MAERRHVLVVGCGFPQLGLIRAARRLGYEITGTDLNPGAVGVSDVDHFLQASTGDVSAICSAYRESGAGGIATSGSELALLTTAQAAERLNLPFYADTETVYRCQAKDAMRAGYRAAGLEVPFFEQCTTAEQARSFASRVGYPLVVKPARGWGQRGVSRVDGEEKLDEAFKSAMRESHGGAGVVLEACITGHELSVNGWVEDGELVSYCVTDREVFAGGQPLGVMRSEIAPPSADSTAVERAVQLARQGARALGLVRGPCYSQVAVSREKAVLFETAARLGGGFDADVTSLACGVDLYVRLLGVAFNDRELERSGEPHALKPAMVRFIPPKPGQLMGVKGLDQVRQMPGVVDAAIYPQPGDFIEPLLNATKRIGHILVTGDSREHVVDRADRAEQTLRFVVSGSH